MKNTICVNISKDLLWLTWYYKFMLELISSELEWRYKIALKGHQLVLIYNQYKDAKLTLIGQDELLNDQLVDEAFKSTA